MIGWIILLFIGLLLVVYQLQHVADRVSTLEKIIKHHGLDDIKESDDTEY